MTDVEIVQAWHEALNAGDVDRLVALCDANVEVGGPRGSSSGHQVLRDWFDRAGLSLSFGRAFHRPGVVVVEENAVWPGSEPSTVASAFWVADDLIRRILRYDGLEAALEASGLTRAHAIGT
jgi:hypothetical protein